jgi:hypothetical protein
LAPFPIRLLELKDGGFVVLAGDKERVRLIGRVVLAAKRGSLVEAEAPSSGSAILVTRRFDPYTLCPLAVLSVQVSLLRLQQPSASAGSLVLALNPALPEPLAHLLAQLFALASKP